MTSTGRLIGVDLARCLALVSMFVAHTAPSAGPAGVLNLSEFLTAPLFALLIGTAAFYSAERMSFPVLFASSVVRAIALVAVGLYIEGWGAQVDIVLPYLGVLSLLMAPLVYLPSWALGALAAASWWFAAVLKNYFSDAYYAASAQGGYLHYLYQWVFTGTNYQAFTLLCYACAGAVVAAGVQRWGAAGDAALAVATTGLAGVVFWYTRGLPYEFMPYTASRLEIGFSLLISLAALGWSCLAARLLAAKMRLLAPFVAAGKMTLSLYVLQVAVLAAYVAYAPRFGLPTSDDSWVMMGGLMVGSLVFAWLWDRLLGATFARRGPLETPLAWISGRG
ncbi:MAG: hypothetical protein Q3965_00545 [Rothia sp. (in: high G+C Gram-positive bacteria)]|nr:hypothetical protein [Rothia sp. (in: high G+C Gram-positive bacteria)]